MEKDTHSILIKNFWTLPRNECENILINLAKISQPIEVRFHVALALLGRDHIDNNTYQALVNTLKL